MAEYTYGATNISWSSTDTWANNVTSATNIAVSSSNGWARDIVDDPGADNIGVNNELKSNKFFYGTLHTKANVSAQVTLPYTSTSISQNSSQVIKNNSYNDNATVRLVASPTYPYVFQKWTSDSAGSNSLSTSATLNLTSTDHTSVTNFYAHVTSPATYSANLGFNGSSKSTACAGSGNTVYWPQDDGANFYQAYKLYTNATLTSTAQTGYYSDGTTVVFSNGGVVSNAEDCAIV